MGEKEQGSIGEDAARSPFFVGLPPIVDRMAERGGRSEGAPSSSEGIAIPDEQAEQLYSGHSMLGASDLAIGD